MTLWDLKQGTSATVESFCAALQGDYRTRLSELGFHPGEHIACVLSPVLAPQSSTGLTIRFIPWMTASPR